MEFTAYLNGMETVWDDVNKKLLFTPAFEFRRPYDLPDFQELSKVCFETHKVIVTIVREE